MKGLQQWVGGIVCFLMFVTMLQSLLPSKKYEKYVRLFAGMILILLVLQPFLGSLRLEERIAYYFEAISFRNDARDFSKEILGIEHQRLLQVFEAYEQAAEREIGLMAEEAGLVADVVQVEIDSDRESDHYGTVIRVQMVVTEETVEGERKGGQEIVTLADIGRRVAVEVAPVEIGVDVSDEEMEEGTGPEISAPEKDYELMKPNESISKLRRKVEQYYGLESNQVKIEYQGR